MENVSLTTLWVGLNDMICNCNVGIEIYVYMYLILGWGKYGDIGQY